MWKLLATVVAAALATLASASDASDVVVLTPENFEQVVDGSKHKEPSVVVAKVDADAHKELGSNYGVSGFPTIKFFPKGSIDPEDYKGGRSEDDFAAFLNAKAGASVRIPKPPTFVPALTPQDFDAEVGKVFSGEESVLVAKVDAEAHQELAKRYGVSGFPTLKYFAPGSDDPEDYSGGRDKESFVTFLNEHAGTHRTPTGGLTAEAGRVKALDVILSASGEITSSVLEQAESLVETLEGEAAKHGNLYIKAIKKVLDKGKAYVATEIQRLDGLLANDNVTAQKKKLFALRKNILEAFAKQADE
ncbi:hypothetical protein PybrP1_012506 [[Pythium] brassicae (nom. inval.)]|nr:hypothetical protein PybrP1_012506 [[Pythium] brassicae (nom. inval.)]